MPLKTLLLSKDSDLVQCISKVLASLDFAVEHCSEPFAAAKCLMDHRFDAIIVDCDDNQGAAWVMQSARMAAMNKNALTLAISGEKSPARATKLGENFHLNKPLSPAEAERTLRAAKETLLKNTGQGAANVSKAIAEEPSIAGLAKPAMNPGLNEPHAEASLPVGAHASFHKSVDLPSAPELLAKMDEAFPSAPVSHASTQGSAAAAAPAREAARPSAAVEPKKSPAAAAEPVAMRASAVETSNRAKTPESLPSDPGIGADSKRASRTEPKTPPKIEAERAVQPVVGELRRADSQQNPAAAKAAKTSVEAVFPAVQPIPAEVAASVTEVGPWVGGQPQDDSPRSSAILKIVVLAGALIAVIAGVAFSRHARHSAVSTAPANSSAPVAAQPDSAGPAVASENNSVAVEPAPPPASTPKPSKTAGQGGDSPVKSKAAADPVIGGEQIAVRLPGGVSSPAAPEEQPVAPPTGVSAPSAAPNLGNVVAPLPAAMPVTVSPTRVTVSQGVSQGLLIRQVKPVYPSIARESHISGRVQLRAIIAKDGTVRSLNVVGGHPLLTKAAIDAVRQWRYKPYLLNGQPVEVETQISIEFRM